MSDCPIPLSALSEKIRRHADPTSPPPLRLMAAKGLVPMGARDMVTALCCLSFDPDEKIADAAVKSLAGLPPKILQGALSDPELHGLVLDHLARSLPENETYIEAILLHQATPDETFAYLADRVGEKLLGIIVNNQVRILRHPPIARAVLQNPNVLKSQVDSLMDFAVRTGMDFSGLEAFEEAKRRILAKPPDVEEAKRIQKIVEDSIPQEMLQDEAEAEGTLTPEQIEERENKKKSILSRLYTMTPAQKLVLAQKGNKTVRSVLIRDHNRVVATTAIRNPGVTEAEVISVAMSRSVVDDVIRIICNNREWTRSYAVKKALVENPKTPIAYSLRFLNSLRKQDLKHIAQNKNIPSAVAIAAKKMIERAG